MPLGWEGGSDSEQITASINLYRPNKYLFNLKFGKIVYGENTILVRSYEPYRNYNSGPFPSGEVVKNTFLSANGYYKLSERFTVNMKLEYMLSQKEDPYFYINFNYHLFRKIRF